MPPPPISPIWSWLGRTLVVPARDLKTRLFPRSPRALQNTADGCVALVLAEMRQRQELAPPDTTAVRMNANRETARALLTEVGSWPEFKRSQRLQRLLNTQVCEGGRCCYYHSYYQHSTPARPAAITTTTTTD